MSSTGTVAPSTAADMERLVQDALRDQLLKRGSSISEPTVPASVVAEPPKEEKVVLGPNQVLFTKLIGIKKGALPKGTADFAVTVLDVAKLTKEVKSFVPSATKFKGYNIQVDQAHALLMAWEMGEKVLITGPTGSGKSSLIEYCCAMTHRPFVRINMTGDIESSILFGQLVVESGATAWKDGPITEAVRYGAVVLVDEWDVTPPEILFGLQWLFEEGGKLFLKEMPGETKDKFITPHDNFRLVCAGNTVGQGDDTGRYSGTNVQNNASIDRFQTTIVLDYLSTDAEEKIIVDNCVGVDPALPARMVSFANLVRTACKQNNINLTMSPRTLINWGRKTVKLKNPKRALHLAFANKLRESDHKIVGEFFQKVFGTAL